MPTPPRHHCALCAHPFGSRPGRRGFLIAAAAAALAPHARAAALAPDRLVCGRPEVAALAARIAPAGLSVVVDPSASPYEVRAGTAAWPVADDLVLYGGGPVRARFLDDARNGALVLRALAEGLASLVPRQRPALEARRRAVARELARRVFGWTRRLARSPVAGRPLSGHYGRPYLLRWAGARLDASGGSPLPPRVAAALAALPDAPAAPTFEGYLTYVEALVAALAAP